jgi:trehalose 6-phosphate phosphatase
VSEAALPQWRDDWALFLDVDGTLLEIAATPQAVRVPVRAVRAVAAAHRRLAGALALVSGRSIADLDRLFAPLKLPAAGSHGAQRRTLTGVVLGGHDTARLEPARALLVRWAAAHEGVLLEDKGDSLALHYRNAPWHEVSARGAVAAAVAAVGASFHIQEGKMVLEIKARATSKGRAIEQFMAEAPFEGRCPVFLGDDLTDEIGFEVVNRLGGHSIAVGVDRPTQARFRLRDAPQVLDWLESQVGPVDAALRRSTT